MTVAWDDTFFFVEILLTNSVLDADIDDLNESFDELLLDSDAGVPDGVDGDDMAPAVVPNKLQQNLDQQFKNSQAKAGV
ncbi:hypothetical protein RB195_005448 [Necator americanus]|uniref:Uncharacterized protein n=1 Tax=Necator americanus TaxID=51031 RepID=A0ABR1BMV7_NECAM